MTTRYPFLMLLALSLVFSVAIELKAHSGAHPLRYVSANGIDQGVCNAPLSPCKTITYAVNQSSKGDTVYVAQGEYNLVGMDIFFLLSDMVEVKGGFSTDFQQQKASEFLTVISGLPAEYRGALQKRGFKLIRDSKGLESQLNPQHKLQLSLYKQLTSQKEGPAQCINGRAASYECDNIDLQSHIPLDAFNSSPSSANDIWGFVDMNNNREYALIGLHGATTVVDVTIPTAPIEVGSVQGGASTWRDIKVYQHFDQSSNRYKAYAYVTTEASQGLQVIDLSLLPDSVSLASTISEFTSAHNVYLANVDYATGLALENMSPYLYVAGSDKDGGAYRVFSLDDPTVPVLVATPPMGTGYIHDATSLAITDPRTADCNNGHNPCELLIDFNEQTVDIWDMTDKNAPVKISSSGYPNSRYTHSGWWSQDKMTIFIQDELDERSFGLNTTLHALDISDLKNPKIVGTYTGQTRAIDHNGFTLGDYYYMSNYRRGLSVIDVSDPTDMKDVGFFDTFSIPEDNSPNFNGAWGTYPYLPSGNILISDIEYGLFVVTLNQSSNNNSGGVGTTNPTTPSEAETSSSGGGAIVSLLFALLCGLANRHRLKVVAS